MMDFEEVYILDAQEVLEDAQAQQQHNRHVDDEALARALQEAEEADADDGLSLIHI